MLFVTATHIFKNKLFNMYFDLQSIIITQIFKTNLLKLVKVADEKDINK